MKFAIVGYGKMGKMVERIALERGHEIGVKLDDINNSNFEGITEENFTGVDAAIDFSVPAAAIPNIEKIASLKVNLVVGTTGWLDSLEDVKAAVEKNDIGLVWSPNFSVGVNAFFRIVAEATKLLSGEPQYEAWAWEIHHSAKKDAPSGTAVTLRRVLEQASGVRVGITSEREGEVTGIHTLELNSAGDRIVLTHEAKSRRTFAEGAVLAAEWIAGRTGFYEFKDIFTQL